MDLHAYVPSGAFAIEFRVIRKGEMVRVDVPIETIRRCFGEYKGAHELLRAYEQHRREIDAAVIRRAASGGAGVVQVRPLDLCTTRLM